MKPHLVTTEEAAQYLGGLQTNTLEGWRIRGFGPAFKKIGRLVRYSTADLDNYLAAQTRHSTSQQIAAQEVRPCVSLHPLLGPTLHAV